MTIGASSASAKARYIASYEVVTQGPCARQKIEMRKTMDSEIREIRDGFGRTVGGKLSRAHQTSEALAPSTSTKSRVQSMSRSNRNSNRGPQGLR